MIDSANKRLKLAALAIIGIGAASLAAAQDEQEQEQAQAEEEVAPQGDEYLDSLRFEGELQGQFTFVSFDEKMIAAHALADAAVVNEENELLGQVYNVVRNESNDEVEYLVIDTKNLFEEKMAVVPVNQLRYDGTDTTTIGETELLDDDRLVLDMSADRFAELADFSRRNDINSYLQGNRQSLAEQFGAGETGPQADGGARYSLVLGGSEESEEPESDDAGQNQEQEAPEQEAPEQEGAEQEGAEPEGAQQE